MSDSFTTATDRKSTMGLDHYSKVYSAQERELKLQLWDTGGMERVASITSSYYKHSEAAILVFALDNPDTFHILSQHLLDIVTYAENAKIFLYVYIAFFSCFDKHQTLIQGAGTNLTRRIRFK